jgi:hypothetical protein
LLVVGFVQPHADAVQVDDLSQPVLKVRGSATYVALGRIVLVCRPSR